VAAPPVAVLPPVAATPALSRPAAQGVTAKATRNRAGKALTVTVVGKLRVPAAVGTTGCTGSVTVVIRSGNKTVAKRTAKLTRACGYTTTARLPNRSKLAKRLSVRVPFGGNPSVAPPAKSPTTLSVNT
jgi:hypothetical protein